MPSKQHGNPVLTLKQKLRRRFPDAAVTVDAPSRADGMWFLDVTLQGHGVAVQWSRRLGFGVSAGRAATYGEGPDEAHADVASAYDRAVALLLSGGSTSAPRTMRLDQLRKLVEVSQVELAKSLDVGQPVISKRERCADMMLSTLRETVEALGGVLDVRVVLREGAVRLELPGGAAAAIGEAKRTAARAGRRKT